MKIGRNSKNAGFSMVELIVVIAIMAILVGVVGANVASLNGRRLAKCADEIVSVMERARVLTLGKEQNNVECIISYDSASQTYKAVVLQGGSKVSERELGKNPIQVKVYFDNEATGYLLEEISGVSPAGTGQGLHVVFNRASGAFVENVNTAGGSTKHYCTKIEVTNSGRIIEILTVGKTGKITKR